MKQTELFTKTQKNAPKDEVSVNAQLLIRAGYADKLMAGVYTFLPLGLRVMKKIENIIREEMNAIGGQEILMPTLQPKENWEITGRWTALDEDMFKVDGHENQKFVLAPTHEEVVIPLAKKFINSYKDLPKAVYQFQNKFRKEKRAKSGLLRGREFLMKDLYSFHLSEADLDSYYEKAVVAYRNIFDRVGIGEKTYKTFASGGTFAKYSHEFQTVTPAGEDIIYICQKCNLAINKEIKSEVEVCPDCQGKDFREEKAIEVGNIFKNKEKYTKPFNLTVKDEAGEDKLLLTGCFGLGLSRLMGTIVEIYHDEKGMIWPEAVAPFKIHLIVLGSQPIVINKAEEIYNDLQKKNIEVLYDDREVSAGEKFADADLIGIPYRIVISEKSLKAGGAEIKKRNNPETKIVKLDEVTNSINFTPSNTAKR
ncbi:MAG: His/Gly/Thr/Pro-type tRNA ligase C-terminal domain-containing protein [Candidatus Moranbacteria bacterium]|nr:His/Gly/Thr/Pro-type tRNA ligase C-terminal domain-containing protein [Candidatus Moranbacteria bacterium]